MVVMQYLESAREKLLQLVLLPRLRNRNEVDRFNYIKNQYCDICERLRSWGASFFSEVNPGYEWNHWAREVERSFGDRVPMSFLSNPRLIETMVHYRKGGREAASKRIAVVKSVFGEELSRRLLRESYIGSPMITDSKWMTSANTAHHAYHLANYRQATGKIFWEVDGIIEWGGGYGNMARITRKMNPNLTYTIIDLPELLALQYVYLYATEGEESVNLMQSGESVALRKVNFLPSTVVLSRQLDLTCDVFMSTWALTESPYNAQEYIASSNFLNAESVLLGYDRNDNNKIRRYLDGLQIREKPVPLLPEGHSYGFR